MKLTAIILFVACLQVSARGYAQVTLSETNASLQDVFKKIQQQTGYDFLCTYDVFKETGKVTINVQNVSLQKALEECLKGKPLTYVIINKTVVVQPQTKPANNSIPPSLAPPPPVEIHGTVTDQKGEPLQNVSVLVTGTKIGTTTDRDGHFTLTVPDNRNIVLEISNVGFQTNTVALGKRTEIKVTLEEATSGLNEVVVVGYGTQKKINLTGAVDVVSGEELQNRPAPNVSLLMQGVSPNLDIAMSTRGGEPGSASSWNLRGLGSIAGNSNPLILIDGVESGVDDLDPENIESVSVLKDASASAIYGSRAPFGVVLITTKRGQKNKGIRVQYNNNLSLASPIRFPLMADALTWATALNEAQSNAGLAPYYPDEQVQRIKGYMAGTYKNQYDTDNPPTSIFKGRAWGNANYDWPTLLLRKNSFSQKHNISLTGGDDKTQYYVSAGLYDQGGLYTWGNDSYRRYNVMANLTSKATKWLSFDFGTKYSQTQTNYPLGIVGTDRAYNFTSIFQFGPMTPMYNADGTIQNPIVASMQGSGRDKTTNNDLWLRLGTEIEPVKGWKTNITYNYNVGSSANSQNPIPVPIELGTGQMANAGYPNSGAAENMGGWNYYIFDAITSYEKKIGAHNFKVMAGYEQELSNSRSLNGSRMNLISPDVPSINAATGVSTLGANADHWATQAVFGRFNYNFKEKYLVEFSGRYNGSSRFAKNSRWGFFPSVSAGYNISKEDFWSEIKPYVNTLKVRGSYGSLGNQNVPNYLYLSTVPVNSNLNYIIDNARPIYAQIPRIISSTLTWETVTTTDLGLDGGFLNNRLGLTFDWYNRKTTNMFGPAQDLPAVLGTGAPYENNAALATKGFELSLEWKDKISANLSYNVRLSLGDNKTTILKYNNANKQIDNWYEKETYGDVWGLTTDGIIQKAGEPMPDQSFYYSKWGPGDIKYKDLTGDNIINEGSRTLNDHGDLRVIANSQPRYNIGFSAGVNWKGFSINMFWQGVLKRDFVPGSGANAFYGFSTGGGPQSEIFKNGEMMNYWRPSDEANMFGPNANAYFPKPYASNEYYKNTQTQSRFVLNAAYMRLKNLQIGYNISRDLLKRVHIENARIYVSGENLITITKLSKSLDPETAFVSDFRYGGLENLAFVYPVARRVSFGINVTF